MVWLLINKAIIHKPLDETIVPTTSDKSSHMAHVRLIFIKAIIWFLEDFTLIDQPAADKMLSKSRDDLAITIQRPAAITTSTSIKFTREPMFVRRYVFSTWKHIPLLNVRGAFTYERQVMLRNIPNKLSQAQLKEIVDESSNCKYDFMYLRIVSQP